MGLAISNKFLGDVAAGLGLNFLNLRLDFQRFYDPGLGGLALMVHPQSFHSEGLGWAQEFACLTSSHVMLMQPDWGTHLKQQSQSLGWTLG